MNRKVYVNGKLVEAKFHSENDLWFKELEGLEKGKWHHIVILEEEDKK